jgi:hypothetical protein
MKTKKQKFPQWTRIPWDGNLSLGFDCWRKSFGRGQVSVGIGDFRTVVFSYGPDSEFNLSFKSEYLPHYLEKTFRAPGGPVPGLISPRVLTFPHSFSDIPSVKAIHGTRKVSLSWIVKRPKERVSYQISSHPSFSGETGKERLLIVNLRDGRQFQAGFRDPETLTQFLKIRNFHKVPGPSGQPA